VKNRALARLFTAGHAADGLLSKSRHKTMKKCRLYQVDSFTTDLFRGNPAGVVPDAAGLTVAQMQAIAREMNNFETAFILSPTATDHEGWIRFFTPTTEVPS